MTACETCEKELPVCYPSLLVLFYFLTSVWNSHKNLVLVQIAAGATSESTAQGGVATVEALTEIAEVVVVVVAGEVRFCGVPSFSHCTEILCVCVCVWSAFVPCFFW